MRIGDRLAVQIEGTDVGEAYIEDIEDGNATIVIPATRIVVKVRNELDLAATREPEVDREFAGVAPPAGSDESDASAELKSEDVGEGLHGKKLDSSAID